MSKNIGNGKKYAIELNKFRKSKGIRNKSNKFILEASNLYANGFYLQALATLKIAVQAEPSNKEIYYLLGLVHEELGNFEKAIKVYFIAGMIASKIKDKKENVIWEKVYSLSHLIDDKSLLLSAINKLSAKGPNVKLLESKLKIFRRENDIEGIILTQIEIMAIKGFDILIFEQIRASRCKRKIIKGFLKVVFNNTLNCSKEFITEMLILTYECNKFKKYIALFKLCHQTHFLLDGNVNIEMSYLHSQLFIMQQERKERKNSTMVIFSLNEVKQMTPSEGNYKTLTFSPYSSNVDLVRESINKITKLITGKRAFKTSIALSLCTALINYEMFDDAKLLIESILEQAFNIKTVLVAIKIYKHLKEYHTVGILIKKYMEIDPTSIKIKDQMFQLYNILYEENKDPNFLAIIEKYKIFNEIQKKTRFGPKDLVSWGHEDCINNQLLYRRISSTNTFGDEDSLALINTFFDNPIVFQNDIRYEYGYKKFNKTQRLDKPFFRRISAANEKNLILKGLSLNDWFTVLFKTVKMFLQQNKYEEAVEISKKMLNIKIFNFKDVIKTFLLVCHVSLKVNSFPLLVLNIKYSTKYFQTKFSPILLFLTNKFQYYAEMKEYLSMARDLAKSSIKQGKSIDTLLYYLSFKTHSYQQVERVDYLSKSILEENDFRLLTLMLGMLLSHSNTRVKPFTQKFYSRVIEIIKKIETTYEFNKDEAIKSYCLFNIAKAYHTLGKLSLAEDYYLKVLESSHSDKCINNMALFNLFLIWKKNKSKNVLISLRSYYR